jgi:hypothetical protein
MAMFTIVFLTSSDGKPPKSVHLEFFNFDIWQNVTDFLK